MTVGLYDDNKPGELFIVMAKENSTTQGFADAFAAAVSCGLQHGVPLETLVEMFSHVRFEPSGMTKNPEVRFAKSIVDYIFRWLEATFPKPESKLRHGLTAHVMRQRDENHRSPGEPSL